MAAGVADRGEQGQRLLMVFGGVSVLVQSLADRAESCQRMGLQVAVAALTGQSDCRSMAGASLVGLAGDEQGFPGAVERFGLPVAVSHLLVDRQRLRTIAGGLVVAALPVAGPAEPDQRACLDTPVADLAGCRNSLPQVAGGLLVTALPVTGLSQGG